MSMPPYLMNAVAAAVQAVVASMVPQFFRTNSSWQGPPYQARMLVDGDATYATTMGGKYTVGTFEAHRVRGGKIDTFLVSPFRSNYGADDHNCNGLIKLPTSGKMMAFLNGHSAPGGPAYVLSAQPLPNLEAGFGPFTVIPNPPGSTSSSYSQPFIRSDGMVYVFTRASNANYICKAPESDIGNGTAVWTYQQFCTDNAPYSAIVQVGDRLHFAQINGNPAGQPSVRHFYMDMSATGDVYRSTDGTLITTVPIDGASVGTVVHSALSGGGARLYDITVDSLGNPSIIYSFSPSFSGGVGVLTDVSLAHARYIPGAGWRETIYRGAGDYDWSMPDANVNHQCGEGCFDPENANKWLVAMRSRDTNIHEIFELTLTRGALADTITETRITFGSTSHQAKPSIPRGWRSDIRALWFERTAFTTFADYYCRTRFLGTAKTWTATITDTDVQAYLTATGITNPARQYLINQFITSLKSGVASGSNVWGKLLAVSLPCVAETLAQSLVDLKTRGTLTAVGAVTFTPGAGWIGDGTGNAGVDTPALNTIPGYLNTSFSIFAAGGRLRSGTVQQLTAGASGTAINLVRLDNRGIRNHNAGFAHNGSIGSNGVGMMVGATRAGTAFRAFVGCELVGTVTDTASAAQTVAQRIAHSSGGYIHAHVMAQGLTDAEVVDLQIALHKLIRAIGADDEPVLAEVVA